MPNVDPVTMVNTMTPVTNIPFLESSHRQPTSISDSMLRMDGNIDPVWKPERPMLTSPDALSSSSYSVYRFLDTTEESRHLGDQILETLGERLNHVKLKIREISTDNIQKLKEAAQRAADSSFWSILNKIATCLLSALSMVFGISLIASGGGTLIGGLMVASGILSLSNFAMSETGAWDWVSKQLASDNEEWQKKLAWILPSAVGILAGGIGIVGSIQSVASGAFQFTEKAVYLAQTVLAIFDAATTFGKGHADAHLIWAQSDVSKIQADLTVERTNFDSVMKEIEGSLSDFRAIKAKTKKIIQTLSKSNIQLTR